MAIVPAREDRSDVGKQFEARTLSASVADLGRVAAAAINGYPNEVHGVLIGRMDGDRARLEHVLQCGNAGREQDCHEVDPQDYLRAERWARENDLDIIGFWHSHPDRSPVPSQTDIDQALPDYSYVIVSVTERREISLQSWRLDGDDLVRETIED